MRQSMRVQKYLFQSTPPRREVTAKVNIEVRIPDVMSTSNPNLTSENLYRKMHGIQISKPNLKYGNTVELSNGIPINAEKNISVGALLPVRTYDEIMAAYPSHHHARSIHKRLYSQIIMTSSNGTCLSCP